MTKNLKSIEELKKMKTIVIINEQHVLTEEQRKILNEKFNIFQDGIIEDDPYQVVECQGWEEMKVPSEGWTLEKMISIVNFIDRDTNVVFVSPIPIMIAKCVKRALPVFIFHNDNREKTERNGKVFFTVAKEGWQLVEV